MVQRTLTKLINTITQTDTNTKMQEYDTYTELCERDHNECTETLYRALTRIIRDQMIREHLEDYDQGALVTAREAMELYKQHIRHDRRFIDKYDEALLKKLPEHTDEI
jgi:hypothetical protein